MFFPYNGECFLQTDYSSVTGTINMFLSLTGEKVAVIDKIFHSKAQDRREMF